MSVDWRAQGRLGRDRSWPASPMSGAESGWVELGQAQDAKLLASTAPYERRSTEPGIPAPDVADEGGGAPQNGAM